EVRQLEPAVAIAPRDGCDQPEVRFDQDALGARHALLRLANGAQGALAGDGRHAGLALEERQRAACSAYGADGLGVGGAPEPREARPQLLLTLDALGQLPNDLLDRPGSQAELEQGGVQARIAPGAPPPGSGQRPNPGEAGEQALTCYLLLVTLVPPG